MSLWRNFCLRTRVNELEAMNERSRVNKNRTSLNFYVYARPFLHNLYFNDARKIYVLTQVKTTRGKIYLDFELSNNPPLQAANTHVHISSFVPLLNI